MCQTTSLRRCLYLMIRQNSTYFAFFADDCWSSTIVPVNQWHHFAFVYDYTAMVQYIYLNGVLTCSHGSSGPFMATTGAITIGAINNTGTTPFYFWTGYLDDVQYVSRAKTATEILDDATLVAYYSFDNGSFLDRGPNRINGVSVSFLALRFLRLDDPLTCIDRCKRHFRHWTCESWNSSQCQWTILYCLWFHFTWVDLSTLFDFIMGLSILTSTR